MVGAAGFEPTTSWSRTRRSTKLSHAPTKKESGRADLNGRPLAPQASALTKLCYAPNTLLSFPLNNRSISLRWTTIASKNENHPK